MFILCLRDSCIFNFPKIIHNDSTNSDNWDHLKLFAISCVIYKCGEIGPTTVKNMKIQSNIAYTKH